MTFENEYKILVVDDAKDTQMLLEFDLADAGCQVYTVDSGEQALSLLQDNNIDLILLDMYMPGLSGLATLEKIKSWLGGDTIPVIMLSSSDDEDEVVAALELGASDYVVKPYVAKILLARIGTALRLKEKTQQLEHLAKTDFLTGINNRGNFFDLSCTAINFASRTKQPLVVAMFDIDFFKKVNDDYGHDAGDKVLIHFTKCLSQAFRGYDILGRIGGEEFAVCLPNTNKDNAILACQRLREEVESQSTVVVCEDGNQIAISITVSIGVTLSKGKCTSIYKLLKQADLALYYAKEHGRNQVVDAEILFKSNNLSVGSCLQNMAGVVEKVNNKALEKKSVNTSDIDASDFLFDGIDLSVGVNNVLGDADLFKEILALFYQEHHYDGNKLQEAIESNNISDAKHLAHTLKGVACSVGAMTLFERAKNLDFAIKYKKYDQLMGLLELLLPEFNKVMIDIEKKLPVDEG